MATLNIDTMKIFSTNLKVTTPKLAGFLAIVLAAGLSFYTKDNTYWTVALPSAFAAITAETVGDKFGNNKTIKKDDGKH